MKKQFVVSLFILVSSCLLAQEKYTISGYLKDLDNGEGLIGATILVDELKSGTQTNEFGFYSLTLPKGEYTLKFTYVGFETISQKISLTKKMEVNQELSSSALALEVVEIKGQRQERNVEGTEMSKITLQMDAVKKIPAIFGEVDILKTIQLLPGIQSGGEGTTGFFVRGGAADQNLILLDGAPVYNASHLLGFFSVFNADAIKDMQIYKGGIPSKFGGRLSSLLDIQMKEGNTKRWSVSGGVGTVSSRLTVEGPLKKDKSSIVVSARRTYADMFLKLSNNEDLKNNRLYFYDLNAKINYKFSSKDKLYLSGYFGRDVFKFGDLFEMNWGNATGTVRWNHLFSEKLFSNVTLISSNFDYLLGVPEGEQAFSWKSNIIDKQLKADLSYYMNPNNTIYFGLSSIHHLFKPGEISASDTDFFNAFELRNKQALEHAVYVGNKHKVSDRIAMEYGLRYSLFQNLGTDTTYSYDTSNPDSYSVADTISHSGGVFNSYGNLEPRLNIRYLFNEWNSIKATYNRTSQYIQQASNSTSSSPLAIWFSASDWVKPQLADQVALGYFKNFGNEKVFEGSIEAYYKKMQNTIDFKDHAQLLLNEYLEAELRFGSSTSYGLEFMIKKNAGKFSGWLSYTYSKTEREIPEINGAKKFFAPYDRTHDVSLVMSYDLSPRSNFGVNWVFSTGKPITVPTGRLMYHNTVVPVYSDRNTVRMPTYHRLDIGYTLNSRKKDPELLKDRAKWRQNFHSSWNFSVYNMYYRKNAFSINFVQSEDDPNVTQASMVYLFAIVPAITYNFHF